MKKLLFLIFSAAIITGCQNNVSQEEKASDEDPLFGTSFRDYREIENLEGFENVTDTNIDSGALENKYRLMDLQESASHLILFYKVVERDSIVVNDFQYLAIDTIQIQSLQKDERITIGYCNHTDYNEGEVIAVVRETDSLYTTDIIKAWRANPESEQIEELQNYEGINCLNEFFESENSAIPVEKIS